MQRSASRPPLRFSTQTLLLQLGVVLLVVLLSAVVHAWLTADQNVLDARLVTLAHTVLAFAVHEIEEEGLERGLVDAGQETEHTLGSRYHYQIWSLDGRLLHRSRHAPEPASLRPLRCIIRRRFRQRRSVARSSSGRGSRASNRSWSSTALP